MQHLHSSELETYIQHCTVTRSVAESRQTHPILGVRYPARDAFEPLKSYGEDFLRQGSEPRMIALTGLRGVGKTTLLWHCAEYFLTQHEIPTYFFNVNELRNIGESLASALDCFQTIILGKRFRELTTPVILLFDEAHDDPEWASTLKVLYDEARTAFIMLTGSSALLLNTSADLARRMRMERIYPLTFLEFIAAKSVFQNRATPLHPALHLAETLRQTLFYTDTAAESFTLLQSVQSDVDHFWKDAEYITPAAPDASTTTRALLLQEYIYYHNIPAFLAFRNLNLINDSINDLFKRVIIEDIPKISKRYDEELAITKLLYRLAASDELNIEELSKKLGVKKDEIENVLDTLVKAEILHLLMPFTHRIDAKLTKLRKAFFMSPSLRRALLSVVYGQTIPSNLRGKLWEDLTVLYLKRLLPDIVLSFAKNDSATNPDFVVETRDTPLLIEVGESKSSRQQITQSGLSHRFAILLTNSESSPTLHGTTITLPFEWFVLM